MEVGEPPASLCEFVRQYDWTLYANSCTTQKNGPEGQSKGRGLYAEMDAADLELRQNLLEQFRKWKRRRRRKWNIVVTERAKREMAAQDDMDGGGGGKGGRR